MAAYHELENELTSLGIIIKSTELYYELDLQKLSLIGYRLCIQDDMVCFIENHKVELLVDWIPYNSNIILKNILNTLHLSKLKQFYFS